MARIQIGGAGSASSNNVIRLLREGAPDDHLIGHCSRVSDLCLADTDERYVLPAARDQRYPERLLELLERTRPDLLHVQHAFEVQAVSRIREQIAARGVRLMLPRPETVEACIDKFRSYEIWRDAGLPVPETVPIHSADDLPGAFAALGPRIWLRATEGGGSTGALATASELLAREWIARHDGLGRFTAARCLTPESITWTSLWAGGRLAVAQTRRRLTWAFGGRTLSGVSGVTQAGETCTAPCVDVLAERAIRAIDLSPHGIFSVDLTYDGDGVPNPTEINIGRFFTTIHFFTRAGLNLPAMFRARSAGREGDG